MLFSQHQSGYFSGGDNVLNNPPSRSYFPPKSKRLLFETHHVFTTEADDVFMVEGNLIFQTSFYYERSISSGSSYVISSSDRVGHWTSIFEASGLEQPGSFAWWDRVMLTPKKVNCIILLLFLRLIIFRVQVILVLQSPVLWIA
ncbi:hypothetical protein Gotur_016547 [Gossypium turneri]